MIMLEYQMIMFFVKGYTPNWLEEGFVIKNFKNTVPWTFIISNLNNCWHILRKRIAKNKSKRIQN